MARATSQEATLPAPIGGWNARDPMQALKPTEAIVLDNLIPTSGGVTLRGGYTPHATGLGASVQSLMEHSSISGGSSLFGAAGTSVFNVTNEAAVGAAVLTGMGNAQFSHVNFGAAGGNYLVIANGSAAVRHYNGSVWATPTINNVTSADLNYVTAHLGRLWFIQKNTLNAWYLDPGAIAGDATLLPLGPFCKLGGSLLAIASWTRDGGAGPDDHAVFITTKGEVLIYSGTDPDDADTWSKVGTFKISEPIGRRCVIAAGADLGIITSQGLIPLSQILASPESVQSKSQLTDNIKGAVQSSYKTAGSLFGWQVIEYAKSGLVIMNVPVSTGTTFYQYVMNVMTGKWCRFTGIPAVCWSRMGDNIYFGGLDGKVYRYDVAYLDAGTTPIGADCLQAFSNFKTPAKKRFTMAKALFTTAQGIDPPLECKVDYDLTPSSLSQTIVPNSGTPWGSEWGSSWGPSIVPVSNWQSIQGIGQVGSVRMKVTSRSPLTWHQTDIMFETGGVI